MKLFLAETQRPSILHGEYPYHAPRQSFTNLRPYLSNVSYLTTRLLARLIRFFLLMVSGLTVAYAAESVDFSLPKGDATETLKLFASQANREILYSTKYVAGVVTNSVFGRHTPRESLDLMVAGTGLVVVEDRMTGALMVSRPTDPETIPARAKTATSPNPDKLPPMNRKTPAAVISAWLALLLPHANAQTQVEPVSNQNDETVVLSPFVVDASSEQGSYKATSTLAGTRVRTDLSDVASPLQVITKQFLQDTSSTSTSDLLVYTTNTEVAGLRGNFSGAANGQGQGFSENLLSPYTTTRVRGLSAADNTRDYFLTEIPWDSFNVGRVDIQRGPNSILFGVGSPGGIINNDLNDADFKNANNVTTRVGSYGSVRNQADFNYVLIPNQLAIRAAWVEDDQLFQQSDAFNNTTRYYGALHYDPNLLGEGNHTSFRVKFENGRTTSDNPRALPPQDDITAWFTTGKPTLNQYDPNQNYLGAYFGSQPAFGGGSGVSPWTNVVAFYNGAQGGSSSITSASPTYVTAAEIAQSLSPNLHIGNLPDFRIMNIASYPAIANSLHLVDASFTSPRVITDPSIFDFYNKLLDGRNKSEWQGWTAANASLSQTFFKDRLAFEVVYDRQHFYNGQVSPLIYAINLDPNVTLPDGTPNPNLGRPMVEGTSASIGNQKNIIDRHSWRGTVTGDLKASDFLNPRSWITRIIGDHHLTGLLEQDNKKTFAESFAEYATTADYVTSNGLPATTSLDNNRQFVWLNYIGPDLSGKTSASGANLNAITNIMAPGAQSIVRNFNSTYNNPNVSPSAPYSWTGSSGTIVTGTQADNPANYVGWQSQPVTWLNANNPHDFPDLVTSASKTSFTDNSQGFTWQGHMLDGTFVPTFGWRRDKVVFYQTSAPQSPTSTFVSTDFSEDQSSRLEDVGETKAWGGVYHLPKSLTAWLPGNTTLSVFYDRNRNFVASVPRIDIVGNNLPNPTGKTKEYGFVVSTLNDKLSLKVNWYNTQVQNETLNAGVSFWQWATPAWGYQYAVALQQGFEGKGNGYTGWNYAYSDQQGGIAGHSGNTPNTVNPNDPDFALTKQIINAWVNDFPLTASWATAYGFHPNSIDPALAKASGQLIDAITGPSFPVNSAYGPNIGTKAVNPVGTVDTLSKGEEVELTAQPIPNWNISVNYARTFATQDHIDAITQNYMNQLTTFFNGPAGQLRMWGSGAGNEIQNYWRDLCLPAYTTALLSQGLSSPEVSPWRFNLVTTYTFDRGKLKGAFIGGAGRLEAGRIEGYRYDATLGSLDVNKPWIGPDDKHYDLWFGYSRRIVRDKIKWRIQANLRNVGEKTRLVASQYQPDGSLALARIQEGMSWQLTNSFDF